MSMKFQATKYLQVEIFRNRTNHSVLWYPGNGIDSGAQWAMASIASLFVIQVRW